MSLRKLAIAGTALTAMMASTAYASIIDRPFFQVLGVVVVWGADGFDDESGTQAPIVSDFIVGLGAPGGTDLIDGEVHTVLTGSLTPISADGSEFDATTFDPITGALTGGDFTEDGDGVLNAGDSLSAFAIDENTDVEGIGSTTHNSSFFVASNTTFNIQAYHNAAIVTGGLTGVDSAGDPVTLSADNITWDMSINTNDDGSDNGIRFGEDDTGALVSQDPTGTAAGVDTSFTTVGSLSADESNQSTVFTGGQRTAAAVGSLVEQSVRFDLSYELDTDLSTPDNQGFDLSTGVGTISSDVTYTVFVP